LLQNDVHYAVGKKIPGKPSKIILLHDNTRAQTANLAKTTLASMGLENMNHLPYSPDLAPAGFHFFGPRTIEVSNLNAVS
jgi:hypothetical protein